MATAEYQGKPVAPDTPLGTPDQAGGGFTVPGYVTAVARAHGLDPRTLWGVFGTESNYGLDKNASTPNSAGALGPFQFLADTWLKYGSSNPADRNNFGASVNAAARYLKALGADGNINSPATARALNEYSGGGGVMLGMANEAMRLLRELVGLAREIRDELKERRDAPIA
jgi:hypothetical protein